jgi:Fic family protein
MKFEHPPIIEINYSEFVKYIENKEVMDFLNEADKRYFYWNEIKYRPNLPLENPIDVWTLVKINRSLKSKTLFFGNHQFTFNVTSYIQEDLHEFDLKLVGGLYKDSITPQDQDEFFKNSLIEEAIASSQIEGAATTTNIARDMIKSGRKPRTESEQMIFNNFYAIRAIEERLDEKLDKQLIIDIHGIMTNNTDASQYSGDFRKGPIYVKDHFDGEIAHTAPEHAEVNFLVESLCNFINNDDEFIHPIVKASILHFMFGYIHPFGDGNGRTARALFYWYLMRKGYTMIKHISISKAILDSRTSYDKAFLKTEYDSNDLNYFIMYSIKSLRVAFQSLVKYRDRKREERHKATEIVYELSKLNFNKRQSDLLGFLYLKPESEITIPQYSKRHDIVRQTASKDLIELEDRGLLFHFKDGKKVVFKMKNKDEIIKLLK